MTQERLEIRAPAEQTEGTRSQVLRWLKQIGDRVSEHEPLVELETDKVTVEVAAPAAGVLRTILRQEQEEIEPGAVLGELELQVAAAALTTGTRAEPSSPESSVSSTHTGTRKQRETRTTATLSPAVQRLLAEHGLEASALSGSGP